MRFRGSMALRAGLSPRSSTFSMMRRSRTDTCPHWADSTSMSLSSPSLAELLCSESIRIAMARGMRLLDELRIQMNGLKIL